MSRFRAVLDALRQVAGATEQLAFQGLINQGGPSSGHVRTDRERLGSGIDVVELKLLDGAASNTLPTEQLDQLSASVLASSLYVTPHVGGSGPGHSQP